MLKISCEDGDVTNCLCHNFFTELPVLVQKSTFQFMNVSQHFEHVIFLKR